MDHLIGQRFSLISKSEIRYVGTLHEINPEQATISLEDVFSFGTEDRNPDSFIPPSQQKFDYIVFRGSDVKDIKLAEEQKETKQPSPPSVPNDPAILNSSRPGPPGPPQGPPQDHRGPSPFPPQGYPQPQFGNFPPPPHQYGRGFGPPGGYGGPGPQFYPPPPGYYGPPPGQGFPPGPNQFPQQPPPPIGPPGQRGPGAPGPPPPTQSKQTSELPDNKPPVSKQPAPVSSKADVVPATSAPSAPSAPSTTKSQPPQSKVGQTASAKSNRMTPAVPFAVNQKSFVPPVANDGPLSTTNGNKGSASQPASQPAPPQASLEDAARQAKAAVAEAMAKLNPQAAQPKPVPTTEAIDALTKKVGEMGTNGAPSRGRGGYRGGRGNRTTSGGQQRKMEIPKSDYDFETANAKFNKEDMIKEAIATGSPLGETPDNVQGEEEIEPVQERKESVSAIQPAYNKSTSFFDNISSEAREREEGADGRTNGRVQRGQEFKKNIETFGQGNVDGGYRGGYRGRGRGRGFARGYNRGYGGGYRGRGRGTDDSQSQPQAQPN